MSKEKRDYNVGLNSKGLEASVSEEQARRMCNTQGQTSMFIVQAHHGPFVTNEDGSIKMSLIMDNVELVPAEHEERLRRFQRALYLTRPDQYGQAAFDGATGGDEPRVEDTALALDAVVETDDEGEPSGIWIAGDDDEGLASGTVVDEGECAYPGCTLPIAHDGDHSQDSEESNVVSANFSG